MMENTLHTVIGRAGGSGLPTVEELEAARQLLFTPAEPEALRGYSDGALPKLSKARRSTAGGGR